MALGGSGGNNNNDTKTNIQNQHHGAAVSSSTDDSSTTMLMEFGTIDLDVKDRERRCIEIDVRDIRNDIQGMTDECNIEQRINEQISIDFKHTKNEALTLIQGSNEILNIIHVNNNIMKSIQTTIIDSKLNNDNNNVNSTNNDNAQQQDYTNGIINDETDRNDGNGGELGGGGDDNSNDTTTTTDDNANHNNNNNNKQGGGGESSSSSSIITLRSKIISNRNEYTKLRSDIHNDMNHINEQLHDHYTSLLKEYIDYRNELQDVDNRKQHIIDYEMNNVMKTYHNEQQRLNTMKHEIDTIQQKIRNHDIEQHELDISSRRMNDENKDHENKLIRDRDAMVEDYRSRKQAVEDLNNEIRAFAVTHESMKKRIDDVKIMIQTRNEAKARCNSIRSDRLDRCIMEKKKLLEPLSIQRELLTKSKSEYHEQEKIAQRLAEPAHACCTITTDATMPPSLTKTEANQAQQGEEEEEAEAEGAKKAKDCGAAAPVAGVAATRVDHPNVIVQRREECERLETDMKRLEEMHNTKCNELIQSIDVAKKQHLSYKDEYDTLLSKIDEQNCIMNEQSNHIEDLDDKITKESSELDIMIANNDIETTKELERIKESIDEIKKKKLHQQQINHENKMKQKSQQYENMKIQLICKLFVYRTGKQMLDGIERYENECLNLDQPTPTL